MRILVHVVTTTVIVIIIIALCINMIADRAARHG
jgi:hypothetical protein